MKRLAIYSILLLTALSCSYEKDLGGNYYYLPEYEAIDIGYPFGSIIYKGSEENHFDDIIIFSDVQKARKVGEYILAYQKPNKQLFKKFLSDNAHYVLTNTYDKISDLKRQDVELLISEIQYALSMKADTNQAYLVAINNLIDKSKYLNQVFTSDFNYYIIKSSTDEVLGPLDHNKFMIECKRRNIDCESTK